MSFIRAQLSLEFQLVVFIAFDCKSAYDQWAISANQFYIFDCILLKNQSLSLLYHIWHLEAQNGHLTFKS